jgi:hypothetical protein
MQASTLFLLSMLFQGALGLEIKQPAPTSKAVAVAKGAEAQPVFYIVVMGGLAYRHQVSLWLSSVRKLGGWKGEVIIVTDKPTCLAKTLSEAKLLGQQISSNGDVNVFGPGDGYEGNLHMIKRPKTGNINKMKLEKARAWLNIKVAAIPHPVSSIIYTDEDVVVCKKLEYFLNFVKTLESQKHTLALFRDTGMSAGELHTGVVVIFPGAATDACLQSWAKQLTGMRIGSSIDEKGIQAAKRQPAAKLMSEDAIEEDAKDVAEFKEDHLLAEEVLAMGPDQQALHRTQACKQAPGHDGIKILPANFFWLPTPAGMKSGQTSEFVHFTNTGRWKLISHNVIKAYLNKIGIPQEIDPMGSIRDKTCASEQSKAKP